MKHILITIVAAVLVVGCGESQQSAPPPETKPAEPVAEAVKSEPTTVKAPNISIHQAASQGKIEAVKQHLATGSDVNVKTKHGETPLHMAAFRGQKEVSELLIAKGADVNAKDKDDETPLDEAIIPTLGLPGGHSELADLLRKHGGKTGAELKGGEPVVEAAQSETLSAKAPDISINDAAKAGNIEAVKQHLTTGADVNAKGKYGRTPLHYAATKEITELLTANGADVNANSLGGLTPLHLAAEYGHKETSESLIAKGADVNAKDDGGAGGTPLHQAAFHGQLEIVKLLTAKGADVNARNSIGGTPLHYTALRGRKEIAELLIAKGADVNAKDEEGETPLDWADGETADLLRKHGGKTGEELKAAGK
jgi:cytohesin